MTDGPVLRAGSATHVGQVRSVNQDDLLMGDGFFAVADGMGGHQGGEVASELAVATLRQVRSVTTTLELTDGIQQANRVIIDKASTDAELAGMGTTVCVLALLDGFAGARLALANVGDSRVYVLREGSLVQLTLDHSLVAELVRDGRITEKEAEHHPRKNVVTRALGVADPVDIDTWELPLVAGERFVLCSDGLFNEVTDNQIEGVLRRLDDPDEAAAELVRLANDSGGRDNITVLIVDVVEAGSTPAVIGTGAVDNAADPVGFSTGPTDVDPAGVGAGDASLDRTPPPVVERRPPFFTWRTAAFGLAIVAVMVAAVWAVGLFARGTYYVGVDDSEQVVIYRGRPGGVLWFDPTLEEATVIGLDDLPEARRAELVDGVDHDSLDSARAYVANLLDEIDVRDTGPSTTSPSTTDSRSPARPTTTTDPSPPARPSTTVGTRGGPTATSTP